jgi:hypothetical protein
MYLHEYRGVLKITCTDTSILTNKKEGIAQQHFDGTIKQRLHQDAIILYICLLQFGPGTCHLVALRSPACVVPEHPWGQSNLLGQTKA